MPHKYRLITMFCVAFVAAAAQAEDSLGDRFDALQRRVERQDQRIAEQDAEIKRLKQRTGEMDGTDRYAAEVRELVEEVIADAQTRGTLNGSLLAGHDGKNFFLASADGNYLLKIMGLVQFRYVLSTSDSAFDARDSDPDTVGVQPTDLDDTVGGFEMRRARFYFKGHVVDPSWQYFLHFQVSRADGDAVLLDAWVKKQVNENLSIMIGQLKVPVWREWMISGAKQPFVERSLVHHEFSGLYTQGVAGVWRQDNWQVLLSANDGAGKTDTAWSTADQEVLGVSARGDVVLEGAWSQHSEFIGWPGEERFIALGAAVHYQQGEYGTATDEAEVLRWAADAHYKEDGKTVFVAIVGNHISEVAGTPDMDQYGVIVQGGLFVLDDTELVARYEWGDLDAAGIEDLSVLTVGINHYMKRHGLKLMSDVGYSFNALNTVDGVGVSWISDSPGWRADTAGTDGQMVIRGQIQLAF